MASFARIRDRVRSPRGSTPPVAVTRDVADACSGVERGPQAHADPVARGEAPRLRGCRVDDDPPLHAGVEAGDPVGAGERHLRRISRNKVVCFDRVPDRIDIRIARPKLRIDAHTPSRANL